MKLLSGKVASQHFREKFGKEVANLKAKGINPCIKIYCIGDDPASAIYVRNKEKVGSELGINVIVVRQTTTTTKELLSSINKDNKDDSVHAILVQLPLPKEIDEAAVIAAINPAKDVDGFHQENVGNL